MADLPVLSEPAKRKLAVQWDTIRDNHKITDEQLSGYDLGRKWLMGAVAKPPRDMNLGGLNTSRPKQAAGWLGLDPSVSAAKAQFRGIEREHWSCWCSSGLGYEVYRDWLDSVTRQVSAELDKVWKGRSDVTDRWFDSRCAPAIEKALGVLVKQRIAQARDVETKRLERPSSRVRTGTGNPAVDEILALGGNDPESMRRLIESGDDSLGSIIQMRQGFDDEFGALLTDVLTLQKPDGRVFENIKAHVSTKGILIMDVDLPIEVGDKLIRTLRSGLRDEFIVDDPGYQEALMGIPAHFQVKVHQARIAHEPTGTSRTRHPPVSRASPPPPVLRGIGPLPEPVVEVPRVRCIYPDDFPEAAQARVFAEQVRAAEVLEEKKNSARSSEAAEALLLDFVLRVFDAFVGEAHKLGMQRLWSGARVESECLDFLQERATEAHLTTHSQIRGDVQEKVKLSKQWKRYRSLLREVADAHEGYEPSVEVRADSDFWRALRAEFDDLATRQRKILVQDTRREWLKAFCRFFEEDGAFGRCWCEGGLDGVFISHFRDIATRAACALGCPPDVEPVEFWLYCLRQNLLKAQDPLIRKEFSGDETIGCIQGLLESSAGYCSRLAAAAERDASEARFRSTGLRKKTQGVPAPPVSSDAAARAAQDERAEPHDHEEAPSAVDQQAIAKRAAKRQATVMPILTKKRWKRGRLVTAAGVGKNSVYEYLDGTRSRITDENRKAIAQALDLKAEDLPD